MKTLQIVLFSMLEEMFKFNRHQYPQDFVLVFLPHHGMTQTAFLDFLDSGLTWRPTLASCFPEILMETTLASVTTNRKIFLPWVLNSKAVTGLEVSWTILDLLCLLKIKNGYQVLVCHIFLNIRTILKGAWTLGSCD